MIYIYQGRYLKPMPLISYELRFPCFFFTTKDTNASCPKNAMEIIKMAKNRTIVFKELKIENDLFISVSKNEISGNWEKLLLRHVLII